MDFKLSDEEKILTEPVKYYNDLKGKNIRKYISNILGTYLGVDSKDIKTVLFLMLKYDYLLLYN